MICDMWFQQGTDCLSQFEEYVEKYYKEPEYKAWFDRTFVNTIIYDVVGFYERSF